MDQAPPPTPPRNRGRFAPGTSGNPNGRPRRADSTALTTTTRRDGWVNSVSGHGTSRDRRTLTRYGVDIVLDTEALHLWRSEFLAAVIIEAIVEDALRRAWSLRVDGAQGKEIAEQISARCEELGVDGALQQAACYERAFGGGAIFPVISGSQGDLREPLDPDAIAKVEALHVLEPQELTPSSYYRDIRLPKFGRPERWRLMPLDSGRSGMLGVQEIHESRLIIFPGLRVSRQTQPGQREGWGDSVLSRPHAVLKDFGIAWGSAATLLQQHDAGHLALAGYASIMEQADGEAIMQRRFAAMSMGLSTLGMLVTDEHDKYTRLASNLSGVSDVLGEFKELMAAAARMPVTRLMGRAPAGLNATGDADLQNWYAQVEAYRKRWIWPQHEHLVRMLLLETSGVTKGREPDTWSVEYPPLWSPTEKETAEVRKIHMDTAVAAINAGIASAEDIAESFYGGDTYSGEIRIDWDRRKAQAEADEVAAAELEAGDMEALGEYEEDEDTSTYDDLLEEDLLEEEEPAEEEVDDDDDDEDEEEEDAPDEESEDEDEAPEDDEEAAADEDEEDDDREDGVRLDKGAVSGGKKPKRDRNGKFSRVQESKAAKAAKAKAERKVAVGEKKLASIGAKKAKYDAAAKEIRTKQREIRAGAKGGTAKQRAAAKVRVEKLEQKRTALVAKSKEAAAVQKQLKADVKAAKAEARGRAPKVEGAEAKAVAKTEAPKAEAPKKTEAAASKPKESAPDKSAGTSKGGDPAEVFAANGVKPKFEDDGRREVELKLEKGSARAGHLRMVRDRNGDFRLQHVELEDESLKGKGVGLAMYQSMAKYLKEKHGAKLYSDYSRSPQADRVWQGLTRAGLARPVREPGAPEDYVSYYVMDSEGLESVLVLDAADEAIRVDVDDPADKMLDDLEADLEEMEADLEEVELLEADILEIESDPDDEDDDEDDEDEEVEDDEDEEVEDDEDEDPLVTDGADDWREDRNIKRDRNGKFAKVAGGGAKSARDKARARAEKLKLSKAKKRETLAKKRTALKERESKFRAKAAETRAKIAEIRKATRKGTPKQRVAAEARLEKALERRQKLMAQAAAAKEKRAALNAKRTEQKDKPQRAGRAAGPAPEQKPKKSGSDDDQAKAALRAIDKTKREPIRTDAHPNSSTADYVRKYGAERFAAEKAQFEDAMYRATGKKITLEEVTHGYAVPDGFEARLTSITGQAGQPSVSWDIYDKATGARAGNVGRDFGADSSGVYAHHALFEVEPKYQGRGIGDAVNGNALRHYEKWGISRVDLDAAWVGRYAWARMGFQFVNPQRKLEDFEDYVDSRPELKSRKSELMPVARELVKKPWKLAKWDIGVNLPNEYNEDNRGKAESIPLGKAFLLSRKNDMYSGYLKIDRRDEGYRTAISKAAVVPR